MADLLEIPNSLSGWAATIGFVITGTFALITMFNTSLGNKRKQEDITDDRLRSLYKDQIEALEDTVKAQADQIKSQSNKLLELESSMKSLYEENVKFRNYMERRDPDDIAYRKRGEVIFNLVEKLAPMVISTNTNVERLYGLIEKHLQLMESREIKTTIVSTPVTV